MSERKLVEAFRTFFEKSVAPYVSQNDDVMREWNHLNKIIGSDPIDYSQIEFYLLLSNKGSGSNLQAKGSHNSIPSGNKLPDNDSKFRYSDFNAVMEKNNFEKKGSFLWGNPTKKYLLPHPGRTSSPVSKASRSSCSTTRNASRPSARRTARSPRPPRPPTASTPPPTASPSADIDNL